MNQIEKILLSFHLRISKCHVIEFGSLVMKQKSKSLATNASSQCRGGSSGGEAAAG
jgi:hypothetical protein